MAEDALTSADQVRLKDLRWALSRLNEAIRLHEENLWKQRPRLDPPPARTQAEKYRDGEEFKRRIIAARGLKGAARQQMLYGAIHPYANPVWQTPKSLREAKRLAQRLASAISELAN